MEVLSVEYVGTVDGYVYDLETEDGTYYAGTKEAPILLKNTDSCYVTFDVDKDKYVDENGIFDEIAYMKENFRLSEECAGRITESFKKPTDLEFEKIMYPFFLYEKKRYAYQEWTEPEKPHGKLEYKGLSIKRRDSCVFVKDVCNTLFEILMKHISEDKKTRGSIEKAFIFARQSIDDLLSNKVPIEKLILSKSLKDTYKVGGKEVRWTKGTKNKEGKIVYDPAIYDIPGPHVQLAIKLREKDPVNYPKPPDRVPYVFIVNKQAKLQHEKVAHPDYLEGLTIDSLYYFEHQLKKPMVQIFDNIIKNTDEIFEELVIKKINEMNNQGSIDKFFGTGVPKQAPIPEKVTIDSQKKEPVKKTKIKKDLKPVNQSAVNNFFKKKSS